MNNEWVSVFEDSDVYFAHPSGLIKSIREYSWVGKKKHPHTTERILRPQDNGNGYKHLCFRINDTTLSLYVHRIIAELFVDNPMKKKFVNHIDCDKSNNNASNLEWVTCGENTRHAFANNRMPPMTDLQIERVRNMGKYSIKKYGSENNKSRRVIDINTGKEFVSVSEAACSINMKPSTLYAKLAGYNSNNTQFKFIPYDPNTKP